MLLHGHKRGYMKGFVEFKCPFIFLYRTFPGIQHVAESFIPGRVINFSKNVTGRLCVLGITKIKTDRIETKNPKNANGLTSKFDP